MTVDPQTFRALAERCIAKHSSVIVDRDDRVTADRMRDANEITHLAHGMLAMLDASASVAQTAPEDGDLLKAVEQAECDAKQLAWSPPPWLYSERLGVETTQLGADGHVYGHDLWSPEKDDRNEDETARVHAVGRFIAATRQREETLAAGMRSLWARLALSADALTDAQDKVRDAEHCEATAERARAELTAELARTTTALADLEEHRTSILDAIEQENAKILVSLKRVGKYDPQIGLVTTIDKVCAELVEIRLRVPTVDVMAVLDQWRPIVEAVRGMGSDDTTGSTVLRVSGVGWSLHDYSKSVVVPPKGLL